MSSFNKYRLQGAYHYDWYETEDWYKYLIDRAVKFCKGSTIDVGGGDGVLASKIPGCKVLDSSTEALKLVKGESAWCDLDDINSVLKALGGKEYEYLACINAIEHFNEEGLDTIKWLLDERISKGAIITTIDYQGGSLGEDHKFEWTYDQMMDFFREFKPKGFRYKDTEWIGVEIKK